MITKILGKIIAFFYQLIFEEAQTINGKKTFVRIKTSIFLLLGFASFPLGVYMILAHDNFFGFTVFTLLGPCLLLYPLIRFLLFGGRDSVAAVVTTVVVEEVLKAGVKKKFKEYEKKKKNL